MAKYVFLDTISPFKKRHHNLSWADVTMGASSVTVNCNKINCQLIVSKRTHLGTCTHALK